MIHVLFVTTELQILCTKVDAAKASVAGTRELRILFLHCTRPFCRIPVEYFVQCKEMMNKKMKIKCALASKDSTFVASTCLSATQSFSPLYSTTIKDTVQVLEEYGKRH